MAILGRPFAIRALFLAPFPYDHLRSRAKKHNTLPARHANCADGQEWPSYRAAPIPQWDYFKSILTGQ